MRYSQVKELARRLSIKPFPDALASPIDESQPQTLLRLWQAFGTVAPDKVETGGGNHCKHIVDLVSLVRHAIDPESPLRPIGQAVEERFTEWLSEQQQLESGGGEITEGQMQWLLAIKDHIASSLMIEQDDFEYGSPCFEVHRICRRSQAIRCHGQSSKSMFGIGIGRDFAVSLLPHHRAYGAVPRRFGWLNFGFRLV